ncbi:WbqC family protein [Thauera mechernichensis]|uniref:WbqC family protein n=1 Tax=Thauera mechernichensis TaxID=82788 RepID=A0ABW3WHI0_9RHOO|nr:MULTISPECIES: WbqC family protein [Thauera]ENO94935.1 WbqC-like family protein [Thauera sp. 28]MDG3064000.1 WbqC family protein [Thauera mechernichensis]
MKLGIMQPYPFPYIGYFELMAKVDRWVAFDVVQYNRRSWMNRNRILHPTSGWQYFCIPVQKVPHGTALSAVRLAAPAEAERRLLAQLQHYRRHAPYFREVVDLVRETFSHPDADSLVGLNLASLAAVSQRIGIAFSPQRCSALDLALDNIEHAGQWALRIAAHLGADAYLNPPGGQDIFRPEEWSAAGIELGFTKMNDLRYACRPYVFEPNLSILDVLMWCSAEEVGRYLCNLRTEGPCHEQCH